MIVDLAKLEGSNNKFEFSISAGDLDLETDTVSLKSDIAVFGEITKTIPKTELSGNVSVVTEIDCTRCLTPIEVPLAFSFEAGYVPSEVLLQESEAELGNEDLDVDALDADQLDMREVVREQILLNLPDQIFCREDCKGLCQKCGGNLNLIDCSCNETETDPRWAALQNLK
ncbi:MAG: DUF177 domain-containing protein [Pyrinomonadaceae bacterium]